MTEEASHNPNSHTEHHEAPAHQKGSDKEGDPPAHDDHDVHKGHAEQGGSHEGHHDHHAHHAAMVEDFRFRFYVSIGVSIPILLLSPMIQDWLGIREALAFPGSIWVLFGLNAFVYVYGGWPFLKGMVDEIRKKTPGMMTLVALAISVAFFIAAPLCWAFLASYSSGKLRH